MSWKLSPSNKIRQKILWFTSALASTNHDENLSFAGNDWILLTKLLNPEKLRQNKKKHDFKLFCGEKNDDFIGNQLVY